MTSYLPCGCEVSPDVRVVEARGELVLQRGFHGAGFRHGAMGYHGHCDPLMVVVMSKPKLQGALRMNVLAVGELAHFAHAAVFSGTEVFTNADVGMVGTETNSGVDHVRLVEKLPGQRLR